MQVRFLTEEGHKLSRSERSTALAFEKVCADILDRHHDENYEKYGDFIFHDSSHGTSYQTRQYHFEIANVNYSVEADKIKDSQDPQTAAIRDITELFHKLQRALNGKFKISTAMKKLRGRGNSNIYVQKLKAGRTEYVLVTMMTAKPEKICHLTMYLFTAEEYEKNVHLQ